MTWLEDLARSQVAEPSLERLGASDDEEESEKLDPFAQGVNPIEWLETLAKRQGAKEEELTTPASMNIPAPQEAEVEDDDYQPFSFDTPPTRRAPEPAPAVENPADWLNSLAGSEGYSEEGVLATQVHQDEEPIANTMSMPVIEDAIAQGTVTREQMQYFLEQQADQLAEEPEQVYEEEVGDDEPLVAAELPDWLSELRPPPRAASEVTRSIDSLFEAPPAVEMPDWLRQDLLGEDSQSPDIASIFQPEEDAPIIESVQSIASAAPYEIEVDTSDPWVEAFDEEYAQGGMADIDAVPEWYEQNLNDPARIAAVEGQTGLEEADALEVAALPEENALAEGQPQAIPSWMTGFEAVEEQEPAASTNVFEEMPDWLKEVEASVSPEDVPDWLVETIGAPEAFEPNIFEPVQQIVVDAPKPAPVSITPPPKPIPAAKPAPTPAPAVARTAVPAGEAAVVIERARDKEQSGDLEGALAEYESMIRSSSALDTVVEELTQLVKSYKTTPAVYRVLGDGLMRQGKLQAALNTYREALNQL